MDCVVGTGGWYVAGHTGGAGAGAAVTRPQPGGADLTRGRKVPRGMLTANPR